MDDMERIIANNGDLLKMDVSTKMNVLGELIIKNESASAMLKKISQELKSIKVNTESICLRCIEVSDYVPLLDSMESKVSDIDDFINTINKEIKEIEKDLGIKKSRH